MDAERSRGSAYRFDRFVLGLEQGVLRASDGAELPLRPKSFALLRLFVENAGRLLDRDAIMSAIWPDVFVTDDSITQCVGDIRRALGEAAPRLLQTLPRRGYRFTGEVVAGDGAAPKPSEQPGVGERRQLTVLFADLVEATALAEQLDPEDVGEIIANFQRRCTATIGEAGGLVARYPGDGVLAIFGYPRAQEDAAERAVRAGLALADATFAAPLRLSVRVAIATGLVVVDPDETFVGKPLHLADRLQALAEPGAVVVAEATRRLVGGLFALENLGRQRLEGFSAPVQAWRVRGEGAAESRFEALRGDSPAPLIGRRQELQLLLDRWELAEAGEGQLVLLAGEAGIGKSRLVRALREALEPHVVLSHQASPQHTDTALQPVIGYLERAIGSTHAVAAEDQRGRLEALLVSAPAEVRKDAWLLAELLGLPGGDRQAAIEPQQRKERTLRVLLGHVTGLAARGPVLAIFEDMHWADPTTVEYLARLVALLQRLPVLAIVTCRPEFMPPWSGYGHATMLSLGRLGRKHCEALMGQVAAGRPVPPAVREQILARTDGVPLFVEELTRMLLEAGELEALAIPETLHDSLTARLDRLAPVKAVAQV
ncbi:MAG: AAA family ATPase, partial [Geminicoccaceae bacterium]